VVVAVGPGLKVASAVVAWLLEPFGSASAAFTTAVTDPENVLAELLSTMAAKY
jgi:hypothetical protein